MPFAPYSCLYVAAIHVQHIISRVIRDSALAITFAKVTLTDNKDVIISGTITDENGHFSLTAQEGNYVLTVSVIGYHNYISEIFDLNNQELGIINLEKDINKLDKVVEVAS